MTFDIDSLIFCAFFAVETARERISSATTANPFPYSPAWADSIAAFMERRFVFAETELIIVMTSPISSSCDITSFRIAFVAEILPSPSETRTRISSAFFVRSCAFVRISSSVFAIVEIATVLSSIADVCSALSLTSVFTCSFIFSIASTTVVTESFICSNSRVIDSMFEFICVVAAAVLVAESLIE